MSGGRQRKSLCGGTIVVEKRRRKPTIFNTAFVDGYACLTDIAAHKNFSMQGALHATSFPRA
jgi:hypothetical protein